MPNCRVARTAQRICRSGRFSTARRPNTRQRVTGWAPCGSRWRTWTLRGPDSSRTSMRGASGKTGPGALEGSLVEVMERREELQEQLTAESAVVEGLEADLASAQEALAAATSEVDAERQEHAS